MTKSQVDRLGKRLRNDKYNETDLKLLDEFRRSFHKAYEITVNAIRLRTKAEPSGRPAKSTTAIIEKLKRESIRLSQFQDIAGCRIVVGTIVDQNQIVSSMINIFPNSKIVDRRLHPSHGYRGVHIIVDVEGQWVEIQVRSMLQHLWAEVSEKLSDVGDPSIKYGGGKHDIQAALQESSSLIAEIESTEIESTETIIVYSEKKSFDSKDNSELNELRKGVSQIKKGMAENLKKLFKNL